MARPSISLDPSTENAVAAAAFDGSPNHEIAALLEISPSTLKRRFGPILTKRRAERRLELRRLQWNLAKNGNTAMLIFLGKQSEENGGLGQSDAPPMEIVRRPDFNLLPIEELQEIAAGKTPRGWGRRRARP
jgi:hypothetical protein